MFTGLALNCLRGLLLDHLGIDLDQADCTVEQLSASHVCLRLQDVALTQALWRLLVGVDYPVFVDYGRVSHVRVEINSDTFYVEAQGVFLKLRLLRPSEWVAAAETYRARVVKDKDRMLNGASQSEAIRRMKGNMKAAITSLTVVLQDQVGPAGCSPHSLAMLCSRITLADPDDPGLLAARAADAQGAGSSTHLLEVPFHRAGRDSCALMAKDIIMDDLHIFISDQPLVEQGSTRLASCSKEDAVCPRLTICVAYRSWEFTAPQTYPEASHEPRKKIVLHMRAGGVEARAAPCLVQLRTSAFMYLLRLACDMDSLLNVYTLVLRAGAADISAKPSAEEASEYVKLWRQHKATRAFGRSSRLAKLENCLAAGYLLRLRETSVVGDEAIEAMEQGCALGSEGTDSTTSDPSVPMEHSRSSDPSVPMEHTPQEMEELRTTIEVSPQLPTGIGRIFSDGNMGCEHSSGSVHPNRQLNSVGRCSSFVADSAIRLHIPDFGLRLDLQGLQLSPDRERLASPLLRFLAEGSLGTLHIAMPHLSMDYIRDMDTKHLAVTSDHLAMQLDSRTVLDWTSFRVAMDDFSVASRKVQIMGQLSMEPLSIWPYLDLLPGWKDSGPESDAFAEWYGVECELPELLQKAFSGEYTSRSKAFDVSVPTLHLTLPPRIAELPTLEIDAHGFVFESSFSGALRGRLDFMQVLCANADLPAELPLLAITQRVMIFRRASEFHCDVNVPSVDVNLAPFMIHVLLQHCAAFDPRVRWLQEEKPSPSTKTGSNVTMLPKLAVNIQTTTLQLWEGPVDSCTHRARAQVKIWEIELDTLSDEQLDISKVQLQIKTVLGTKSAPGSGDVGLIFLSSTLDRENSCTCTQYGALNAEVTLANGQSEVKVKGASLHLAPTVELLNWAYMVIPFQEPSSTARPSGVASTTPLSPRSAAARQQAFVASEVHEMTWCSIAENSPAGSGQGSKILLIVEDAAVALHLPSTTDRPALVHVPGAEMPWIISQDEGCLSTMMSVDMLSVQSTPAGVRATSASAQHLDISANKLCMAILHSPAAEASASPRAVVPVLAALLLSTRATAILPSKQSSSASVASAPNTTAKHSFTAVAVNVQNAAVWTTSSSKVLASDAQGSCTLTSSDPRINWPSCPLLSAYDVEHNMQPLLLLHGRSPWLDFAMNGVCVSGCQEASANGFYSVQPCFRHGAAMYRKPGTKFHLSSDGLDGWLLTNSFPAEGTLPPDSTIGSCRARPPMILSLDSPEGAAMRVQPCTSDTGMTGGSCTVFVISLAPTLLNGPEPGLHALRQVYESTSRLLNNSKKDKEVSAGTAPVSTSGQNSGAAVPESPSLQLFLHCQLDIAFPQGASGSWLRVRCVPRWPKRDVVGELQETIGGEVPTMSLKELSFEIMTCATEQPMHCLAPHSKRHAADSAKSQLQVTCSNLYFRMGTTPGKEVTVSIPRIHGSHQMSSGWSTFLQPSESDVHIDFHYLEGKQLDLYIWPTALSVHHAWVAPLGGFLADVSHWHSSGVLDDLKADTSCSLEEPFSCKDYTPKGCVWEGVVWVCQLGIPQRRLVQLRSGGAVWDVTTSRRGRQLLGPEDEEDRVKASEHESAAFPFCLKLHTRHSNLQIATSSNKDSDVICSVLTAFAPADSVSTAESRKNATLREIPGAKTLRLDVSGGVTQALSPSESELRREKGILKKFTRTVTEFLTPIVPHATASSSSTHVCRDPAASAEPARVPRLSDGPVSDHTSIEIEVKGFEIWFATDGEEAIPEREATRELCLLVAVEARGVLNTNVSVSFPDLLIAHASKPNRYPTAAESLESSFASLTNWASLEEESLSPGSPCNMPATPQGPVQRWVQARLQSLGATTGDKLMVTDGLKCMILWSPRRVIGIRADDILVRVPLELFTCWRGLQANINSITSCFSRGSREASESCEDAGDAGKTGHTHTFSQQYSPQQHDTSNRTSNLMKSCCNSLRGCCSCMATRSSPSKFSDLFSQSGATSEHDSKSNNALSQHTTRGDPPWAFEIEILKQVEVKFEGGLLAPSQWITVRLSEILLQACAPSKHVLPPSGSFRCLTVTFRCEALCHNKQLALMDPIVESVGVEMRMDMQMDGQRSANTWACSVSSTRVNLYVHRVLVEFCKTIHQALQVSGDRPLRPIRSYAVLNLTDVEVQVHWRGRRERTGRLVDGKGQVLLPPKQSCAQKLEGILERCAELHFQDKEDKEIVTLDLDYTHSRMYMMETSGRHVLVDSSNDMQTGTCVFHIRSAVVIYNETDIPIVLSREQQSIPMGFALEAVRLSPFKPVGDLQVPPGCSVNVPLSWFSFQWQNALIRPELDGHRFRTFPQLSKLLCSGAGDDELAAGANNNGVAVGRGVKLGRSTAGTAERSQERVNFHAFFSKYLKLMGCVDAFDVPMGGDHDDLPPAQRFEMRLKDVIIFRNTLPFPIILQVSVKDSFAESVLPIACIQNVLRAQAGIQERDVEAGAEVAPSASVQVSGRCFEPMLGTTSEVKWKSELQGIIDLTVERKVVSYVLGVDQDVALPFAKRAVYTRLFALPEVDSLFCSFVSRSTRLFLPANHDHIPWPKPITLWRYDDESYSSAGRRSKLKQNKQTQALQVNVEVTRNIVTLFAPLVIENLTPFTLHINAEDPTHLLQSMQRRLLPRHHQLKDTAFVALKAEEKNSLDIQGQEVAHISDLNRLHRLSPMRAPQTCLKECGLVVDSLSFGVCVRMAQPPLEFTKVVSILPRFCVYSELKQAVYLCLKDPNSDGDDFSFRRMLSPGESFPVHLPDSGDTIFISDDSRRCLPFNVEPVNSGVERQRTFHVEMINEEFLEQWKPAHGAAEEEMLRSPPRFYQVSVQQAELPAKEQHSYICGGYSVVLRDRNFCGSEDVLFHVENKTSHDVVFFVDGSGSLSLESGIPGGVIRHDRRVSLEPSSHRWVYRTVRTVSEQPGKTRYDIALHFYDLFFFLDSGSSKSKEPLVNIDLKSVLVKGPNATADRFAYKAKVVITQVTEGADDHHCHITCSSVTLNGAGWTASAVLVLADDFGKRSRTADSSIYVSDVISAEAEGQDSSRVSRILGDRWNVTSVAGAPPLRSFAKFVEQVKDIVDVRGQAELMLQLKFQINHVEEPDGVQHFIIYDTLGALAAGSAASSTTSFRLDVSVPILSVSWLHRHAEVLALRVKGIDVHLQRDSTNDCYLDASMQHLQVDHFEDGDLPVVLNRRLLHVNSRWLNKKALTLQAKWSPARHIIPEVIVDCVPYWLNLELGVLIRLLERYDSGFNRLGEQSERSEARPLLPPESPVPAEDSMRVQVWRLMKIVINPLTFTIHMRSPERSTFTYNLVARWIMRLPADMPNMDIIVKRFELLDQFGTPQQLLKNLMQKYKDKMIKTAVRSIILSYMGTVLKGLLNALVWLARGPFDAVVVAHEMKARQKQGPWCMAWLWWVSPLIHGLSEGMYRALAEVIGNSVFGLVLFLNSMRHFIFGVTRRRAQGILDGMVYGFQGLLFDSLVMPFSQLYYQTLAAHQDWGWGTGAFVCFLCLLRILLGLGPVMGVFHFLSCICEGVANVLLHEEAQFAPFENQRTISPVSLDPVMDDPIDGMKLSWKRMSSGSERVDPQTTSTLPRKWWLFTRAREVITDDDEVMEKMMQALHP